MGKDIVSCRDYIVTLRKQNETLQAQLTTLQQVPHDVSLSNIPKDDLVREVLRARKAIRTEVAEYLLLETLDKQNHC